MSFDPKYIIVYFSKSEFAALAGGLAAIGGLGIYLGNEVHPGFYSQAALLFGTVACAGYRILYLDKRENTKYSINSEGSHSESR